MDRRTFLGTLCAASALCLPSPALAEPPGKIRNVERHKLGLTFKLALDHAPFPFPGSTHKDPTVMVFVPSYYRLPARREVDLVVYFHGHFGNAERTVTGHSLREQLCDSKQNAVLVVPQGPWMAPDSSGGKLDEKGGLARMLGEVRKTMQTTAANDALGQASIAGATRVGMICLAAHSGGYKVAAQCLRHGGVNVNEVYLFDALYSHVEVFHDWVVARKDKSGRDRHKLMSFFQGGASKELNLELMKHLQASGVRCLQETKAGQLSRADLTKGRAVFMGGSPAHHATSFGQNNLRDCLFASGLTRSLQSDWFEKKGEPRAIDVRPG